MDGMGQADYYKAIIEQQAARIREQEATIADLRALVDGLRTLKAGLGETLEEFRRKFFGASSEKARTPAESEDTNGDEEWAGPEKTMVKSHARERKKKSTRNDMYEKLPIREIRIPVPENGRSCPYCNAQMDTLGYKFVREEIRIISAKAERIHYMQEVLICPECRKDKDGTLVQAEVPAPLLKHSPVSASMAAYVMYQGTFNSLPYYRQENDMAQLGALVPRETMANWYIRCAQKYFLPVYERMHELLLGRSIIHADGVPCQVLHEEGKEAHPICGYTSAEMTASLLSCFMNTSQGGMGSTRRISWRAFQACSTATGMQAITR